MSHNPYKTWTGEVRTKKLVPELYRSCHWRPEKGRSAQKSAWCRGCLTPLESSGFDWSWRVVFISRSLGSREDAGEHGLNLLICLLFIFSEMLWLNFCETRGLTSLLMRLFLSPHYMNGHRYSIGIHSPRLSWTQSLHRGLHIIRRSGSLDMKSLTLTSYWRIMVPATTLFNSEGTVPAKNSTGGNCFILCVSPFLWPTSGDSCGHFIQGTLSVGFLMTLNISIKK